MSPGDKITVDVHPYKDGAAGGYLADEDPLRVNGGVLIEGLRTRPDEEP